MRPTPRSTRPTIRDLAGFDRAVLAWCASRPPALRLLDLPFDGALDLDADVREDLFDETEGDARSVDGETLAARDDLRGRLAGMDEAGRGALAGPVTVGCVSFRPSCRWQAPGLVDRICDGLGDSKIVLPDVRKRLFDAIGRCADWSVGCASASEVDAVGIVEASARASARALARLPISADLWFLDRSLHVATWAASRVGEPRFRVTTTGADGRSLHVAAASIIAKVWRDRLMGGLGERFPGYDLAGHKGYGTPAHRLAIRRRGPSVVHRRTFLGRIEGSESQSC